MAPISSVVFDLGGVLIDWNPRHLYRRLFRGDEQAMEDFLQNICTSSWNEMLDAGQSFDEGVSLLQERHPEHRELIAAYRDHWEEMIPGPIEGGPELLREVKKTGIPVYALSNWSAETYPIAEKRFDFLGWFDDVVISGRLGIKKPDPAIFEYLMNRQDLRPDSTLFIDDSEVNVAAAERLGLATHHFRSIGALRSVLVRRGVLMDD
ncbi:MAG: HAD family phosphatase [Myxococcales bacterium]|nr:HAD family phosphatase [Myxococcales bacterium]